VAGRSSVSSNAATFPMYQSLLTNRYLTSRIIPLLAIAAVALCVALVIVVVSVMSGFLEQFRAAGRTLIGDVIVSGSMHGIPYYDDLIERIERDPLADAATPVVETWGVLRMPYDETAAVQIWGIEPESFDRVTDFAETLYWDDIPGEAERFLIAAAIDRIGTELAGTLTLEQKVDLLEDRVPDNVDRSRESLARQVPTIPEADWITLLQLLGQYDAERLQTILDDAQWTMVLEADDWLVDDANIIRDGLAMNRLGRPAIIAGMHVSKGNVRTTGGTYEVQGNGRWWLPRFEGTLTTIRVDREGGINDPENIILPFANEFLSNVRMVDKQRVLIPLETAQEQTGLFEAPLVDGGIDPARATQLLIRAAEGVTPEELLERVVPIYEQFHTDRRDDIVDPETFPPPAFVSIVTWEEMQADFIGPVEKERMLMWILFSIVYIVCAALVLAIMWSIVQEKTRDIGILRSIGATRRGIVGIYLLYGLVIGIIGGIFGFFLGWLITYYIDDIHDMLGEPPMWLGIILLAGAGATIGWALVRMRSGELLPTVLGTFISIPLILLGAVVVWAAATGQGFVMWDADTYYFPDVPNSVDLPVAIITMCGGIVFSVLGAFIPAAKAADMDPIKALRYE